MAMPHRRECRNCGGEGFTAEVSRCPACNGRGFVTGAELPRREQQQDPTLPVVYIPDEVWIGHDGKRTYVRDLDPEHMRNILRLILKTKREQDELEAGRHEVETHKRNIQRMLKG